MRRSEEGKGGGRQAGEGGRKATDNIFFFSQVMNATQQMSCPLQTKVTFSHLQTPKVRRFCLVLQRQNSSVPVNGSDITPCSNLNAKCSHEIRSLPASSTLLWALSQIWCQAVSYQPWTHKRFEKWILRQLSHSFDSWLLKKGSGFHV